MNTASSNVTALSTRPGRDPVFGDFGGLIRTTFRGLRMQWFLYRRQHARDRPIESVGEMNAHMLRDIGMQDEMIGSSAGAKPAYERYGIPFGLSVVVVSLALAGVAAPADAGTATRAVVGDKAQAQVQVATTPLAAVFVGEYINGAPVYRLPAVVVTGTRKDETAAGRQPPCRQTLAQADKNRA